MKNQYRQWESKKITIKAQYTQSEWKEIHQTLRSQLFGLTKGIGSLYQSHHQNLQSAFSYRSRLLKATDNQTFNRMLYWIAGEWIENNLMFEE